MEHLTILKPDQTKLQALFSAPSKPFSHLVINCHGFSGAKENSGNLFAWAEKLNENGFAILAFDFAGSGESDGTFSSVTLSRQIEDLQVVIEYAAQNFHVPLLLLGRSFGGSTIIGAGHDPRVSGCILWSAAIRLEDVFRKGFGEFYARMEAGETIHTKIIQTDIQMEPGFVQDLKQHDMVAYLRALGNKPILALQGLDDWLVSPQNAELIQEICPNAEVHFIEKADHRFEKQKSFREDLTLHWLKQHFSAIE